MNRETYEYAIRSSTASDRALGIFTEEYSHMFNNEEDKVEKVKIITSVGLTQDHLDLFQNEINKFMRKLYASDDLCDEPEVKYYQDVNAFIAFITYMIEDEG